MGLFSTSKIDRLKIAVFHRLSNCTVSIIFFQRSQFDQISGMPDFYTM